jgi:GNAT superfamily N-acetyltransferase
MSTSESPCTAVIDIDTDPQRLDVALIHAFLADSYWARGIPVETVRQSIEHSLCFGLYDAGRQVGFARVISDYTTFAYLADVFVVQSHRGRGLSRQLMMAIRAHPRLQHLRRWMLVTRDAHALYAQFGFDALAAPERVMERVDPDVYLRGAAK